MTKYGEMFIVSAAPVLVAEPRTSNWLHEIKWDGWRTQIIRDAEGLRIYTRHQTDWTKRPRANSIPTPLSLMPS